MKVGYRKDFLVKKSSGKGLLWCDKFEWDLLSLTLIEKQ